MHIKPSQRKYIVLVMDDCQEVLNDKNPRGTILRLNGLINDGCASIILIFNEESKVSEYNVSKPVQNERSATLGLGSQRLPMYRVNEMSADKFIAFTRDTYGLSEENARRFQAEIGPSFNLLTELQEAGATQDDAFNSLFSGCNPLIEWMDEVQYNEYKAILHHFTSDEVGAYDIGLLEDVLGQIKRMIEIDASAGGKPMIIKPRSPNEFRALKQLCGMRIARKKAVNGDEFTWYRSLTRTAVLKHQKRILDEIPYAISLKKAGETHSKV